VTSAKSAQTIRQLLGIDWLHTANLRPLFKFRWKPCWTMRSASSGTQAPKIKSGIETRTLSTPESKIAWILKLVNKLFSIFVPGGWYVGVHS
jgi:hypothetical protein